MQHEMLIVSGINASDTTILAWILANLIPRGDPRWILRSRVINLAAQAGNIHTLDWLAANLPPAALTYTELAIDTVSPHHCSVPVLNWFARTGREIKYSARAMERMSKFGWVNSLQWFVDHGLELK
ncbi:hypothetical protein H9P43_007747 [Blastocladiella emersonii ATCC 22665]|nr:hypothetical protein H9P43_007747 [Blastocladiella emersonii ATCC 22665]